jgi:hypothetical protein
MGRDDDIGQLQKRMISRRGLLDKHIKGGAGQMAGFNSFGQRLFVNDAAAGAIEYPRPLRKQGQFLSA